MRTLGARQVKHLGSLFFRTQKIRLLVGLIVAILACAATGTPQSLEPSAPSGVKAVRGSLANSDVAHRDARYRLCASDVIAVSFPLTPEFDQTVSIEPDGFAAFAGAGSLRLEGMTTDEATAAIRNAYAKTLRDPIVTIDLKDFNKPYFVISGQVNRPGKYDLRGDMSASQAVAEAGGFNNAAKHSQVLLFRRVNEQWYQVRSLNLKQILAGRGLDEDAELESGDMLYVPQNFISKAQHFIPSSGFGAYYQLHP